MIFPAASRFLLLGFLPNLVSYASLKSSNNHRVSAGFLSTMLVLLDMLWLKTSLFSFPEQFVRERKRDRGQSRDAQFFKT
jgi:hypothetical protein